MINRTQLAILSFIILLTILAVSIFIVSQNREIAAINSFDTCAAAGYPVQESYPARCTTPDKRTFTQVISQQDTTIMGTLVCLPHRHKGDVQTLECAFGLRDRDGQHYALNDPTMKKLVALPFGETVTVQGSLDTTDASASNYDILGTITVQNISQE